jgi:glycerophosphoryl diester phosphodiesterase
MPVPNSFTGGTPAVADDVNENFADLDDRLEAEEAARAAADTALDVRVDVLEARPLPEVTQAELDTHAADTTSVHGIADTSRVPLLSTDPADEGSAIDARTGLPLSVGSAVSGRVADLAEPWVVGHRGTEATAPELTLAGYRAAVAAGSDMLDIDVWRTETGALVVMHDSTIDRTTNQAGSTTRQTAESWQLLTVDGTAFHSGWPSDMGAPPLLEDLLREFGGNVPLMIEPKNTGAAAAIARIVADQGLEECVLMHSFTLSELVAAHAIAPDITYGYVVTTNTIPGGQTPATLQAAGITHLHPDISTVNDAAITGWIAEGMKVYPYHITRLERRDHYVALGCVGVLGHDPGHLSKKRKRGVADPFGANIPYPGQLAGSGTNYSSYRGTFAGGKLQFPAATAGMPSILQGWGSPVGGYDASGNTQVPASGSIEFDLTFDALPSDLTRYAGIHFCGPTDAKWAAGTTENGYFGILKADGTLLLERHVGSAISLGTNVVGAAPTAGQTIRMRAAWTPTQVSITRLDTGAVRTITDATFRGGFFWLCKSDNAGAGLGVSFSNVAVA